MDPSVPWCPFHPPLPGRLPPSRSPRLRRVCPSPQDHPGHVCGAGSAKVVGPTTQLTFLGIQLHSTRLLLSLPEDKLHTLRMLQTWVEAKCIQNTRQFQSLVGHLVHATQVLPLGKAFLNRLFPLARQVSGNAVCHLNTEAKADLAWWITLWQHWSGISTQQFLLLQEPSHHLFTDASGSWGCGAWSLPSSGASEAIFKCSGPKKIFLPITYKYISLIIFYTSYISQ